MMAMGGLTIDILAEVDATLPCTSRELTVMLITRAHGRYSMFRSLWLRFAIR